VVLLQYRWFPTKPFLFLMNSRIDPFMM
jgi:hypothetical protein